MLPPEYKEFENIMHRVFDVNEKYIKKEPDLNFRRLDLIGDGYEGTFYIDLSKNELVEKPKHYGYCKIELKKEDEKGNKTWIVNAIINYSDTLNGIEDVIYEFIEDATGKINDGVIVFREDSGGLNWNL